MTKGYPWGCPAVGIASLAKTEGVHIQRCRQQGRDILDEYFPGDIQATECPSLDEVPRVVESAWVDREDLSIVDIHVWTEKVKQHAPGPQEALLIDTGEESSKILIIQA